MSAGGAGSWNPIEHGVSASRSAIRHAIRSDFGKATPQHSLEHYDGSRHQRQVAIIGMGCSRFASDGTGAEQLVNEAFAEALRDAGMTVNKSRLPYGSRWRVRGQFGDPPPRAAS